MENSVEQNTKWMNWNDFNESGEFAKTEKLALNLEDKCKMLHPPKNKSHI